MPKKSSSLEILIVFLDLETLSRASTLLLVAKYLLVTAQKILILPKFLKLGKAIGPCPSDHMTKVTAESSKFMNKTLLHKHIRKPAKYSSLKTARGRNLYKNITKLNLFHRTHFFSKVRPRFAVSILATLNPGNTAKKIVMSSSFYQLFFLLNRRTALETLSSKQMLNDKSDL